jgi:hypothetical protein
LLQPKLQRLSAVQMFPIYSIPQETMVTDFQKRQTDSNRGLEFPYSWDIRGTMPTTPSPPEVHLFSLNWF